MNNVDSLKNVVERQKREYGRLESKNESSEMSGLRHELCLRPAAPHNSRGFTAPLDSGNPDEMMDIVSVVPDDKKSFGWKMGNGLGRFYCAILETVRECCRNFLVAVGGSCMVTSSFRVNLEGILKNYISVRFTIPLLNKIVVKINCRQPKEFFFLMVSYPKKFRSHFAILPCLHFSFCYHFIQN